MAIEPIELDEERQLFIERLGVYYEDYGIPRIGGRMLALLLVIEQPLTAEQMAQLLHVSRGSISTNVRLLTSHGLLERTSIAGQRTVQYAVSESIWERAVQMRIDGFKSLRRIVEQGTAAVGQGGDDSPPAQRRLREMLQWVDTMIDSHEQARDDWSRRRR